jgi:hypothetical protein
MASDKVTLYHQFSLILLPMLAIIVNRAKVDLQVSGVVPHLVDGGLSILQYDDDTILFMEYDLEEAKT